MYFIFHLVMFYNAISQNQFKLTLKMLIKLSFPLLFFMLLIFYNFALLTFIKTKPSSLFIYKFNLLMNKTYFS